MNKKIRTNTIARIGKEIRQIIMHKSLKNPCYRSILDVKCKEFS